MNESKRQGFLFTSKRHYHWNVNTYLLPSQAGNSNRNFKYSRCIKSAAPRHARIPQIIARLCGRQLPLFRVLGWSTISRKPVRLGDTPPVICMCVSDRGNNVSRVMSRLFVCGRVRAARHSRCATIRALDLSNDTVGHGFAPTMHRYLAIIDDHLRESACGTGPALMWFARALSEITSIDRANWNPKNVTRRLKRRNILVKEEWK